MTPPLRPQPIGRSRAPRPRTCESQIAVCKATIWQLYGKAAGLPMIYQNGDLGESRLGCPSWSSPPLEGFIFVLIKQMQAPSHEAAIHCFTRRRPTMLERKDMAGWESIRAAVCSTRPRNFNKIAVIIAFRGLLAAPISTC